MKYAIFIVLLFFTFNLNAQENTQSLNTIKLISEHRDYILNRNPNAILELKDLFDKWETIEPKQEVRMEILTFFLYSLSDESLSFENIKKALSIRFKNSMIPSSIIENDLRVLRKNFDLLDLIFQEVLEATFPFKMNPKSEIYSEIDFYAIHKSDKIAEIGAGRGTFGILINRMKPETQLYLTELNIGQLFYVLDLCQTRLDSCKNMELIAGDPQNTNLEGYDLDKIIIRNSFHHFKYKNEMLKSIRRAMKEDGVLYINETPKHISKEIKGCHETMRPRKMLKILRKNGFILTDSKKLKYVVLYKFEKDK